MERKKCQICDGPIVNGRCKLCGMPYRNDEVLYHLNENRSEHYKHAGERAREIMRQNEIPLGEKKAKKQTVKKGTAAGSREGRKNAKKTAAAGRILILVILLASLGYNLITDKIQENREIFKEPDWTEEEADSVFFILTEEESQEVNEYFPEGRYIFYCPDGNMTVQISNRSSVRSVTLSEGVQKEFDLKEGDVITLTETEYSDQELWISDK